jgi:hypothetical protein
VRDQQRATQARIATRAASGAVLLSPQALPALMPRFMRGVRDYFRRADQFAEPVQLGYPKTQRTKLSA